MMAKTFFSEQPPINQSESPFPASENCLFVANLPQRLTNGQLAQALLDKFSSYGPIVAVKASRDHRGRPFGFVEFVHSSSAQAVLNAAAVLSSQEHEKRVEPSVKHGANERRSAVDDLVLQFRRIRVELAKCQKKICVKQIINRSLPPIAGSINGNNLSILTNHDQAVNQMRDELLKLARPEDIKLSLHQSSYSDLFPEQANSLSPSSLGSAASNSCLGGCVFVLIGVVKFEEKSKADCAFEIWKSRSDWTVSWINTDRMTCASTIRASGLVQLVPGDDSVVVQPSEASCFEPTLYSNDIMAIPSLSTPSRVVNQQKNGSHSSCSCPSFHYYQPPSLYHAISPYFPQAYQHGNSFSTKVPALSSSYSHRQFTPYQFVHGSDDTKLPSDDYGETHGGSTIGFGQLAALPSGLPPSGLPQPSSLSLAKTFEEAVLRQFESSDGLEGKVPCVDSCAQFQALVRAHALFIGRLNSQLVSLEGLCEKFSPYGSICYIRLFMRGVIGCDGVPLDSYAFLIYQTSSGEAGPPRYLSADAKHTSQPVHSAIKAQVGNNNSSGGW